VVDLFVLLDLGSSATLRPMILR